MSTDTVLTDERILGVWGSTAEPCVVTQGNEYLIHKFARAIEQAVLQSPEVQARQWQPIETAPKDSAPILLFARLISATNSTIVVGYHLLGEWLAQSYIGQGKAILVPSHWMPLPHFPTAPLPGPVEPTT